MPVPEHVTIDGYLYVLTAAGNDHNVDCPEATIIDETDKVLALIRAETGKLAAGRTWAEMFSVTNGKWMCRTHAKNVCAACQAECEEGWHGHCSGKPSNGTFCNWHRIKYCWTCRNKPEEAE